MKKIYPLLLAILLLTFAGEKLTAQTYENDSKSAILDNMLSRRAIRKYTPQQVSKAQIDTIMKYAVYAPSAWNKQPWEIRVLQNKQWLEDLNKRYIDAQETKPKNPKFSVFHNSPTLIVIARDKNNATSYMDCGIILQNILLSSHGIGLGSCPLVLPVPVINAPENEDLLRILNIPEDYEVVVCISLGYAAENPPVRARDANRVKIIE